MKYYVTFEIKNYGGLIAGGRDSEHTWICEATDEALKTTLDNADRNKHRITRIVRGEEVTFKQVTQVEVAQ